MADPKETKNEVNVKFACEVRNQRLMVECGYSHLEMGKRVVDKKTKIIGFKEGLLVTSDPIMIKFIRNHRYFTGPKPRIIEIKAGSEGNPKDRILELAAMADKAERETNKARAQAAEANGKLGAANKRLKELEEINKQLEAEKKKISAPEK